MGKGRIKITNRAIANALGFPGGWIIEEINPVKSKALMNAESEMLISGAVFPETNNRDEAEDCTLIVHEKERTFEVKKV
ncbi:hypothetical protein KAR91_23180 [Candidatus Pacearchaeota archaeon]|nr:hypothetical protein [Candidatus Pacearchaeota archaeon]